MAAVKTGCPSTSQRKYSGGDGGGGGLVWTGWAKIKVESKQEQIQKQI